MDIQHKRFMVLSFPEFYPGGGMRDFTTSFDTREEAEDFVEDRSSVKDSRHWDFEIFDCDERQVVYRSWTEDLSL